MSVDARHTPVLLIAFRRPDETRRVLSVIGEIRPQRLYIAADGPRNAKDEPHCAEVRRIVSDLAWDCQPSFLFQKVNLGCKHAPVAAIDWFFQNEEEGIILEDDCIPSKSFFLYCAVLLDRYRRNPRVWHIAGNNFGIEPRYFKEEAYSFSSLPQVWGWATWRDRWKYYEKSPFAYGQKVSSRWRRWPLSNGAKIAKLRHLKSLRNGLDAWDYQWHFTVFNHGGLCVYPSTNLVSNIGNGETATHTVSDTRTHLPRSEINAGALIDDCSAPALNQGLTRLLERKMGLYMAPRVAIRKRIKLEKKHATMFLKKRLRRATLKRTQISIVIASTGRAGSTVLFNTVAAGWVRARTTPLSFLFPQEEARAAIRDDAWRLAEQDLKPGIVYKTHDLPLDQLRAGRFRTIFVFTDPWESVLSAYQVMKEYGQIWLEEHLWHLGSSAQPKDLFSADALNFCRQMECWLSFEHENVMCIDYRALWENAHLISRFLGFDVSLPPYRARRKKEGSGLYMDREVLIEMNARYLAAPLVKVGRSVLARRLPPSL